MDKLAADPEAPDDVIGDLGQSDPDVPNAEAGLVLVYAPQP